MCILELSTCPPFCYCASHRKRVHVRSYLLMIKNMQSASTFADLHNNGGDAKQKRRATWSSLQRQQQQDKNIFLTEQTLTILFTLLLKPSLNRARLFEIIRVRTPAVSVPARCVLLPPKHYQACSTEVLNDERPPPHWGPILKGRWCHRSTEKNSIPILRCKHHHPEKAD